MVALRDALWSQCTSIRSKFPIYVRPKIPSISMYNRLLHKKEDPEYEEFYRYTSGRWLWAEEARLQERYKKFNVPGLKRIAAKACGAQSCTNITKLAEGGFNKVFRLSMDNGSVVIARIPNPNTGFKAVASEVATMDFVRNVIGIPVPRVLAWNGGISNSAESEYILMEHAEGTQLGELWIDMELDAKFEIVDDVIAIQKKLQSVTFSRYGNLYFKSDAFEGCSKADISGDLPHSAQTYAEDRFVIGPIAEKSFWETEDAFTDRGPWPDAQSYLRAISLKERSKTPAFNGSSDSEVSELPQARLSLLDKFDAVSPYLPPRDPILNRATLSHWDLRAPNIFVKGNRVTSLIDWQDAWVGPFFMQERRPHLIEYHGEIMLRLPDYYETMENEEEKARMTDKVEKSILHWYYGRETLKKNPILQQLFDLPMARTRRETVLFASEIWDGEVIPIRECLYQLQRHWDKLHLGLPCPISFTGKEIEAQDRESAAWNEKADFWSRLNGFVSRDGYTSIENYAEAREMFEGLREEGLARLSGTDLAEFEEHSRWAKRSD